MEQEERVPTSDMISVIVSSDNSSSVNASNSSVMDLMDYDDYDIDDSMRSYDWAELIPTATIYSAVFLLGVTGNALIILTISRHRRLKTITNIFLASLASADLLLIIVCVPVNLAKLFSFTWTFGEFLCKFVHYVQSVSVFCSVLTLTAMSIERYYAIMHPLRAQYMCTLSQAKKVIGATWIASLILALPTVYIQIQMPVGERHPSFWCVRDWDRPLLWKFYELYMLVLVLIVPLVIMSYTYSTIAREICSVTSSRSAIIHEPVREVSPPNQTARGADSSNNAAITTTRQQTDHRTARQVVKMLSAVVFLFALCWTPFLIDNVLASFGILATPRFGASKHMRIAFHLLSYFNSCVNPFVYGFMSRNFRRGFKSALRTCNPCTHLTTCCSGDPESSSSCCCQAKRHNRSGPVYRFSRATRSGSRTVTASVRFHEVTGSSCVRSVGVTTAVGVGNCCTQL